MSMFSYEKRRQIIISLTLVISAPLWIVSTLLICWYHWLYSSCWLHWYYLLINIIDIHSGLVFIRSDLMVYTLLVTKGWHHDCGRAWCCSVFDIVSVWCCIQRQTRYNVKHATTSNTYDVKLVTQSVTSTGFQPSFSE